MTAFDFKTLDTEGMNTTVGMLDDIETAFRKYCVMPSEHAYVAIALWVAMTHVSDAFEHATRLVVRSAVKRAGKSRTLEVVGELVSSPIKSESMSSAAMFRMLQLNDDATVILDEADTIFGTKIKAEQNEDLRGLLNAGFRKGGQVIRCVGPQHTPTPFPVFAPAALGGINRMPDTIEDRAVVIVMQRRRSDEHVQPFRYGRDAAALHSLRADLKVWAEKARDQLAGATTPLPVEDRAADVWEPLVAIADLVGGEWPARARAACVAMTKAHEDEDGAGEAGELWDTITRSLDGRVRAEKFTAKELLTAMQQIDGLTDSPFADWTPKRLASALREYQLTTKRERHNGNAASVYNRAAVLDIANRYVTANDSPPEGAV